ncbi:MAG TPA: MBL fold metallo-hydrolase [Candidatus Acidoferrum sp.]|nr:MBL fold metallo-hydrolase [Candidatus Acidoferrum sp.]
MKITFLGAAGEVGRSCIMISAKNTSILLDAGIKLGQTIEYPQITDDMLRSLDGIFISHAHIDHNGFIPHIYSSGYRGNFYATKPTIEVGQVMISDYIRISNPASVTKKGLEEMTRHAKIVEYHKEMKLKDLTIKFIPAGHILGSAIIEVNDGKNRVAYTGDICLNKSRLLEGADIRSVRADTLITESTYGAKVDVFPNEKITSQNMAKSIKTTLQAGGKVIVPSFAVGRAQEVLFLLDDYMNSGILPRAPIYVDGMINKVMRIYRHNVIYCRKELQSKILMSDDDPFKSKNFMVVEKKSTRNKIVNDSEPGIIVTTSGMLSGGPVMFYMSKLARNSLNKMLLVGYQAIGTMGRMIQEGAKSVVLEGHPLKIEMDVSTFHLSAHADRPQLERIMGSVKGLQNVFMVHGELTKAKELREFAARRYDAKVPLIKEEHNI